MQTFYNVQYVNTKHQMEIRKDIQTINKRILVGIVSNDEKVINEQIADFDKRFVNLDNIINSMDETLGDKEKVAVIRSNFESLKKEAYNLLDMAKNGKGEQALEIYNTKFNDITSEALVKSSSEVGDLSDKQAEDKYNESIVIKRNVLIMGILIMIAGISVISVGFIMLIKNITSPVKELETAAKKWKWKILILK